MRTSKELLAQYEVALNSHIPLIEDFAKLQKSLFLECIQSLKTAPTPEADCLIGMIGLSDGDKYNFPTQNAIAHLKRAYEKGFLKAGIHLTSAYLGAYEFVPEQFKSKNAAVALLKEMAEKNYAPAMSDLSLFYMNSIMEANEQNGIAPDDWFNLSEKYAQEAADLGYSGGYKMLGIMNYFGFGYNTPQNLPLALEYYKKTLDSNAGGLFEYNHIMDAKYNIGCMYYNGEGVTRDRRKGLSYIREAADMNHQDAIYWLSQNQNTLQKEGLLGDGDPEITYDSSLLSVDDITSTLDTAEKDVSFESIPSPEENHGVRTKH